MSMTLTDDQIAALLFDSEPWFSCEDCFEHIDVYVEQLAAGLDPGHRAMEVHLKGCPPCGEEAATLLALLTGPAGPPPAEF